MLASGKQLSNGKIKELYLKASLTGPTFFSLLLFFSSDVADVRCCSDWLWNSSLKCLALSFSSLFWFSSLELKFFVSGSLSTHSLDPTCWHTSFQTDVNTWIFKADSVKAQSRPYGLNSSVTIPWHCLVCRSLCISILMTLFSCAVPSLSTDYISEAK